VHAEAVEAAKARITATMILLLIRDITKPPWSGDDVWMPDLRSLRVQHASTNGFREMTNRLFGMRSDIPVADL